MVWRLTIILIVIVIIMGILILIVIVIGIIVLIVIVIVIGILILIVIVIGIGIIVLIWSPGLCPRSSSCKHLLGYQVYSVVQAFLHPQKDGMNESNRPNSRNSLNHGGCIRS